MATKLLPVYEKKFKKIAENNGFQNFVVTSENNSEIGEGFSGTVISITIKNEKKELHLILKLANPVEDPFLRSVYLKEIYIYETVFSAFEQFQRTHGLEKNGFDSHAKYYGHCTEIAREGLILENLTKNGFKLLNKKLTMTPKHIEAVLKVFGRLHAVSLAMRQKNPKLFKELVDGLIKIHDGKEEKKWAGLMLKAVENCIDKVAKDDVKVQQGMRRMVMEGTKFLWENKEDHIVIVHGDCWNENILFRYENKEETIPVEVRLIDWQLSRFSTPVIDLSYFIAVNSSKEVFDDYIEYLKIYHESLSQSLSAMGCDTQAIFPFSKLMDHWKKYAKNMVFMAIVILKIIFLEEEDLANVSIDDMDHFMEKLQEYDNENTNKRMYIVFRFLVENNLV